MLSLKVFEKSEVRDGDLADHHCTFQVLLLQSSVDGSAELLLDLLLDLVALQHQIFCAVVAGHFLQRLRDVVIQQHRVQSRHAADLGANLRNELRVQPVGHGDVRGHRLQLAGRSARLRDVNERPSGDSLDRLGRAQDVQTGGQRGRIDAAELRDDADVTRRNHGEDERANGNPAHE